MAKQIRITLDPIVAVRLKDTLDAAIQDIPMSVETFSAMTILSSELGRNIREFNKDIDH